MKLVRLLGDSRKLVLLQPYFLLLLMGLSGLHLKQKLNKNFFLN